MKIDVNVYHHDETTAAYIARLERSIAQLRSEVRMMSAELVRLTTEVAELGGVIDSAIALINGLAEQIRQCDAKPEALGALADSLDAKAGELGAAVAANTPAEYGLRRDWYEIPPVT